MKINEFVERVSDNDKMLAIKVNKRIEIGTLNTIMLVSIPEDATNFIEIDTGSINKSQYWDKEDREYLSSLIEEFIHTPIKERFPEKKYRLVAMRYIEGPVATRQYISGIDVGGDYVNLHFGFKEDAITWTDTDLHNLSEYFPKEAIDAMKERVEDD